MADDDDDEGSMDLNLNLSPPSLPSLSPPHLGLALGSAPSSNHQIFIGQDIFQPRLCRRPPGFELNILSDHHHHFGGDNGGGEAMNEEEEEEEEEDDDEEGEEVEEEALHELLREPESHSYRSMSLSQGRRRWRRHVRRIRPTALDATPVSVISEPMSPFIILRALDHQNPSDNDPETLKENRNCPLGSDVAKEGHKSNNNASNFECNICLDMARDPVVTSCGHLFCWACLYQWLHVHSISKECPVCKGEVADNNITPIYGRGNCEGDGGESKIGEDGEKIPPRPRAHRTESLRQRIGRPISRRFVEAIRLTRRQDGQQNDNRADGDGDRDRDRDRQEESAGVENLLGAAADQILSRLRLVQLQRRTADLRRNAESQRAGAGTGAEERERWQMRQLLGRRTLLRSSNSTNSTHFHLDATDDHRVRSRREGERENLWEHMEFNRLHRSERASSERLAAIRERVASMEGMIEALTGQPRNSDALPNNTNTSANLSEEEQGVQGAARIAVSEERASVSSTNAIIQTGSMEQDSGRSSSPQRRRNGASASLDVDGGLLHVRKRRRLN